MSTLCTIAHFSEFKLNLVHIRAVEPVGPLRNRNLQNILD